MCSSSVTDSSDVDLREVYAAGLRLDAAVFSRRPNIVSGGARGGGGGEEGLI